MKRVSKDPYCRARIPPDWLRHNTSAPRNATPNARALDAPTRTGLLNARTKSLAFRPVPPTVRNSHSGMAPIPRAQWGTARPLETRTQGPPDYRPLPRSLDCRPRPFRPLAHSLVPPLTMVSHPPHRLVPDRTRLTKLGQLRSRLSPQFPPSYSPGSCLSPMLRYRPWEVSGSSFPIQLWGTWT